MASSFGTPSFGKVIVCVGLLSLFPAFVLSAAQTGTKKPPQSVAKRPSTASKDKGKTHPLTPVIRLANESLEAVEKLKDYEVTFSKREVIKRSLQPTQTMRLKVRKKPFSVYMRFKKPHAGREVIYFTGRNNGNLLAHETGIGGLVGTVELAPTSDRALSESKYPITSTGMAKMLEPVIAQWKAETKYGEIDVKYYPNATLGKTKCKVVETTHPQPRRQFRFHMTRLYIDKETNLPVRLEQFGFPVRSGAKPPLLEQFTYTDIKTNVGLKDIDFDTRNPKYKF